MKDHEEETAPPKPEPKKAKPAKPRAKGPAVDGGSREARRGNAGVNILAPIRFSAGSDPAAATELLQTRLNAVHRSYVAKTVEQAEVEPAEVKVSDAA